MRNAYHPFRALLLLGVALATTLTLLIGAVVFPVPGFAQISSAHAMNADKAAGQLQTQSRCASQPNAQNCTNQDPVVQGCEKDAQTLAFKEFIDLQGNLLATLQRRYSPTCHAEWGRILDNGKEPLQIIVNQNARSTKGTVAYSVMVFVPNLSVAPEIMGTVSTSGIDPAQAGGAGLETTIPALPAN
jgi:hypothetical protein